MDGLMQAKPGLPKSVVIGIVSLLCLEGTSMAQWQPSSPTSYLYTDQNIAIRSPGLTFNTPARKLEIYSTAAEDGIRGYFISGGAGRLAYQLGYSNGMGNYASNLSLHESNAGGLRAVLSAHNTSGGSLALYNSSQAMAVSLSTSGNSFITGNLGIGTSSPSAKLDVVGDVKCQRIIVNNKYTIEAPDYVFEKDYPLPTLAEVEAHVRTRKHLAGVPSAAEMKKNGVELSELNMILLKKVEELTLYTIALNKKIEALEKK